MSFSRLLTEDIGKIILVNLHHTARSKLVSDATLSSALANLHSKLSAFSSAPTTEEIWQTFRSGLFGTPTRFQVQGRESPRRSTSISAVVAFDKVRAFLDKIAHRAPRYRGQVDAMTAPDAPDGTVAKAADLINSIAPRAPDFTLSDWNTVFWAAPSSEVDRIQADCLRLIGRLQPSAQARHLRDALGLVQLDADIADPNRHIFLFEGRVSLSELAKTHRLLFRCARPTTLDGWDNRRFCQPGLSPPPVAGCGMTVNLANGAFGPGAAELVSTPVPIMHFECRYVGPLDGSDFGTDAEYLAVLLRSGDLSAMASDLDRMITP